MMRRTYCNCAISFISCCFITVSCVLFLSTTIPIDHVVTNSHQVGDILQSPSLINSNSSVSSIKLNLIHLGSATAKVYKSSSLPITRKASFPASVGKVDGFNGNYSCNALGQDQPIYLLPGSILRYSLQVNNTGSATCPVKLHLFNDNSMYFKFMDGNSGSPLLSTPCIMESTKQPLNLIINESSVYYIAIQIAVNVSVNYNISGTRVYYSTVGLASPDGCKDVLSSVNSKCEVKICDDYLCIYDDSNYIIVELAGGSAIMNSTNIRRYWMDGNNRKLIFYISVAFAFLSLLTSSIFIICTIYEFYKKPPTQHNETDETTHLINNPNQYKDDKYHVMSFSNCCFAIILLLGLSIICLGVSFIYHTLIPINTTAIVSVSNDVANYPILLDSNLYKSASCITLRLTDNITNDKAAIYINELGHNEKPVTRMTELNKTFPSFTTVNFSRGGLNYYSNDTPVNLAKSSQITYEINVSSSSDCIRFYLIHSINEYFIFINSTTNTTFNGYINRTRCLTNGMSIVIFNITSLEGDYYVAYEAPNDASFTSKVHIKQVYYVIPPASKSMKLTSTAQSYNSCCGSFICLNSPPLNAILITRSAISNTSQYISVESYSPYFDTVYGIVAAALLILAIVCGVMMTVTSIFKQFKPKSSQSREFNVAETGQTSCATRGPPDASKCKVSNINNYGSFQVDCKEAGGNGLSVGICGDYVPAEFFDIKHNGDFTFTVTYDIKSTDKPVTITVKWHDQDVPGSPFPIFYELALGGANYMTSQLRTRPIECGSNMQLSIQKLSDDSWGLIELQGVLETRKDSMYEDAYIGDLHFSSTGVPNLIVGHHLLTGKVVTMDQPLAVIKKTGEREYGIVAMVTKKIIFKDRPKPLVGLPPMKQNNH